MVAVAVIGSAVVGGVASIAGSSMAANAQEDAANKASDTEMKMYQQTRSDLLPYQQYGQLGTSMLTNQLSSLSSPVSMTEADLQQTPGYQFNLTQGLKAAQSSAAARGLGRSGAAVKGAEAYATGLADSTYQNQFNNAVTNKMNTYNMLSGAASLGENAAAQTGNNGTQTAANIGSNTIGAGNAQAAAYNSIGSAVAGGANSIGSYALLRGSGLYGGGAAYPSTNPTAGGVY